MRFRFRMERMLNFLELKETTKKMETATLIQKKTKLESMREERQATIRDVLGSYRNQITSGSEWVPYQVAKVQADSEDLYKIELAIKFAIIEIDKRKQELARIAMRRKGLSNLKEKRHQEFKLDQSRLDQKRTDELYRLVKNK